MPPPTMSAQPCNSGGRRWRTGSRALFSLKSLSRHRCGIPHLIELFACVAGIRHFRYMLEGRPFTIYTDHKPLTFPLGKVSEPWTAMQSRQLSYPAHTGF